MMHKLLRIGALVAATQATFTVSLPEPAHACSLVGNEEHVVDSDEEAVDTTPPGVPQLGEIMFYRRPDSSGNGCNQGASSCDGSGSIGVAIDAPADDRSPPEGIGYLIEIDGEGLDSWGVPAGAVRADANGIVWLHFSDEGQEIDLTISVRAMDLGGNLGEPATIEVSDPGSRSGCSAGTRSGSVTLALVILALAVALRRRSGAFAG